MMCGLSCDVWRFVPLVCCSLVCVVVGHFVVGVCCLLVGDCRVVLCVCCYLFRWLLHRALTCCV